MRQGIDRTSTAALFALLALGCDGSMGSPLGDAGLVDGGVCGDLVVQLGEGCDDGNAERGDGCDACRREVGPARADEVVDAPGATGMGFRDPMRAVNGVRGGGPDQQSLDVYSVGIGEGQWLVLGWQGRRLVDGPGPDLAVFENPFGYGAGLTFMDPAIVELSADGETWVALPHDYVAPDETRYSAQREHWLGFAGVTPVLLNEDDDPIDPFDAAAGGDVFDLADLPNTPEADVLRRQGARYVRIVAAASRVNPDTGAPFVRDPVSDGPDIDGIAGRYLVEDVP
jgi:cysteine-rich repeat protein